MNDFQILEDDVRNLLPMLPDNHFQTCITSPPYYGLRDYGTGTWEGGDPDCTHSVKLATSIAKGELSKGIDTKNHSHQYEGWKGGVCGRCEARKTDNQIGLEGTFQEWVEEMVLVFRELRRTLKDDGTPSSMCCKEYKEGYAKGNRRPPIYLRLPNGGNFSPDTQALNGVDGSGWLITGEEGKWNITPSILQGHPGEKYYYHGWVKDGILTDSV